MNILNAKANESKACQPNFLLIVCVCVCAGKHQKLKVKTRKSNFIVLPKSSVLIRAARD